MSKKSGIKSYPAEFHEKAVKLVTERGDTLPQVTEQLGCSTEAIRRWKQAATKKLDPELAAQIELEESETKRLRKRVAQLEKPNEKWVTDITYVATFEGWLYLVAIIDLFSRKVIG